MSTALDRLRQNLIRSKAVVISEPKYTVMFVQSGLPLNVSWSVTFAGSTRSSTTNTISFIVYGGPYSYSIPTQSSYIPYPTSGSVYVSSDTTVNVSFSIYQQVTLTFVENGVVPPTSWSVVLDSTTYSTTTDRLDITVTTNLTYNYTVNAPTGNVSSPPSGSVGITQDTVIPLTFSQTPIPPSGGGTTSTTIPVTSTYTGPPLNQVSLPSIPSPRKISKHIAENILSLYTQFGHDYQSQQGWFRIDFPKPMNSPHVVAVSGPRSTRVPRADLVAQRRAHFIGLMENAVANLLSDVSTEFYNTLPPIGQTVVSGIQSLWDAFTKKTGLNELFTLLTLTGNNPDPVQILGDLVRWWFVNYTTALWDYLIDPVLKEVINSNQYLSDLYGYAEAFGLDKGRAVHHIDVRNVDSTGFEWYSFGGMEIDWIAEGFNPQPPQVPQQITDAINTAKQDVQNRLGEDLHTYIQQQVQAVLGGETFKQAIQTELANLNIQIPASGAVATPVRDILKRLTGQNQ